MNAKRLLPLVGLLVVATAFGQSDKQGIRAMFDRQVKALNSSNIDMYMSTVDPRSPVYGPTKKMLGYLFGKYQLKYTIEKLDVLAVNGRSASVLLVLTTKRVSGPGFRDNRTVATNTVTKVGGKWVTTATKVSKIDYLN